MIKKTNQKWWYYDPWFTDGPFPVLLCRRHSEHEWVVRIREEVIDSDYWVRFPARESQLFACREDALNSIV